ncbi:MAG TPA: PQQ-binding-like beta-propeller repeat protein [Ktedonobacteraceae bacterium]|nr:PQQ-binding-like beta-propeller repeat protein [Ktedonobacteraceae bacterium]
MERIVRSKLFLILTSLALLVSAALIAVSPLLRSAQAAGSSHPQAKHFSFTPGADWPELMGDAARDGSVGSNTILNKANATSLVPVSGPGFTTTGSAEDSPVVYQGVVYYAANQLVGKTHVSTMYAVDASSGNVLWSVPFSTCGRNTTTQFVSSTAAVTTGLVNGVSTVEVFIGWGTSWPGAQGCIFDFNGTDGSVIWRFVDSTPVFSSPSIVSTNNGNIVVIGDDNHSVHGFPVNYTGTLGGTPTQRWKYDDRADMPPPGYSQYCAPAPINCGETVWSSPAEGLVMVNGQPHHYIFFSVGAETRFVGRVDAIDIDQITKKIPKLVWSFWDPHPMDDNDFGTISALVDSNGFAQRVYAGTNSGDEFGLDAATGNMDFDYSTTNEAFGGAHGRIRSVGALVTINGTTELLFGTSCGTEHKHCPGTASTGFVFAIDALSTNPAGTLLWRSQNFGDPIISSPVVVNQGANAVVYMMGTWDPKSSSSVGDLIALDPATGNILADYPVYNHAYGTLSTPAVDGNRIFVTEGMVSFNSLDPSGGGLAAFECSGC